MNEPEFPVVIVGAGPTGITAATLLGRYGVRCLVLDRWADVYPQPRAVHLDDEVFRLIARLGIRDEFAAISRPSHGLRLVDHDRRVLAEFRRTGASSAQGYPRANMFDQPELERILRANLAKHPAVTLRGNVEVTSLEQDTQGRVRVCFTDRGSKKGECKKGEYKKGESVLARYVLGCDGAGSLVRSSIGATMEDLRFEQRWLVVDVAATAELGEWEGVHQVCDPSRAATYMRVGETRYRWEFRLLPGETSADFDSMDKLHPLIKPWTKDIGAHELELLRVAEYTFRARIADRWRHRNVFILGDAAHLTPPFIGQGLCAGLRDAANLSWKLAGVLSGELPDSVLDSYEAERKPHARAMIRLAMLMGTVMTEGGAIGNALRRLLAPRLALLPGVRGRVLDSRTPALRCSPFVVRSRRDGRLAGTLCPNPVLEDGKRLDEHVTDGFLLVTAVALPPETSREVERRGAVVIVVPPGSDLHRWLRRHGARAALVRPDRTVMRAGRSASDVCGIVPVFRPPQQRRAGAGQRPGVA